jgi:hypothetical protein
VWSGAFVVMLSFPQLPELLRLPGYVLALGSIAYLDDRT